MWTWRAPRKDRAPERTALGPAPGGAFAGLSELLG
jgi:hypothetical protein